MANANQVNVTVVDATSSSGMRGQQPNDMVKGNFTTPYQFVTDAAIFSGNVDISVTGAGSSIDQYTLLLGDTVLLGAQTNAGEIGIYDVGATTLTMNTMFAYRFANKQFPLIQVLNGSINHQKIFQQVTPVTTFNGTTFSTPLHFVDIQDNPDTDSSTLKVTKTAGVNLVAGDVVALDPTALNQVVKCDCTVNTSLTHNAYGVIVAAGAIGSEVTVAINGEVIVTAGSFVLADIGKNVFVDPAVIGGFTLTVPATVGTFMTLLGKVSATNKITLAGVNALSTLI